MKTLKKIRNGLTAAGLSALMVIAPYEAEAQLAESQALLFQAESERAIAQAELDRTVAQ